MVAEPTDANYSDISICRYIETYPLFDERGEVPYTWDATTSPPHQDANEYWIPTYDLHAAAADIWAEKAALLIEKVDVSADGTDLKRSQMYAHAMFMVRYHSSRKAARTMTFHKWPKETTAKRFPWIGNLPEEEPYPDLEPRPYHVD